ncbi:hypothetical protein B0H63DRAFT_140271 [Podospora didyma]|uniref:Secreted protein n=1 Tax=Podospora didyma TaxID=330526 RepID=A0AAE0NSJ0_9PEZI|nr:hypothetical protein B0H63DRAFT_140271 [Podospora didyma]
MGGSGTRKRGQPFLARQFLALSLVLAHQSAWPCRHCTMCPVTLLHFQQKSHSHLAYPFGLFLSEIASMESTPMLSGSQSQSLWGKLDMESSRRSRGKSVDNSHHAALVQGPPQQLPLYIPLLAPVPATI